MIRFGFILVEALYGKSEFSAAVGDIFGLCWPPSSCLWRRTISELSVLLWLLYDVKQNHRACVGYEVDHRAFNSGELFATGWDITTNLAAGRRSDKLWFRNSSVKAISNWIKSFTPITSLDPFRIVFDVVPAWCYIAQILVSDHWELNNTERKYAGSMVGYIALEIRTSVILHLVVISDQLIGGEAKFVKSEVG